MLSPTALLVPVTVSKSDAMSVPVAVARKAGFTFTHRTDGGEEHTDPRGDEDSGDEERQGLAFHVDLGQNFILAESLYFSVGGHFELGTPLGASALEFVGFGVGPFVSIRWGA